MINGNRLRDYLRAKIGHENAHNNADRLSALADSVRFETYLADRRQRKILNEAAGVLDELTHMQRNDALDQAQIMSKIAEEADA